MNKDNHNIMRLLLEADLMPGSKPEPKRELPELTPVEEYIIKNGFIYSGMDNRDTERIWRKHIGVDGKPTTYSHHEGGLVFIIKVATLETPNGEEDLTTYITIKRYRPSKYIHSGNQLASGWDYEELFDAFVMASWNERPKFVSRGHHLGDDDGMLSLKNVMKKAEGVFEKALERMTRDVRQGGSEDNLSDWEF